MLQKLFHKKLNTLSFHGIIDDLRRQCIILDIGDFKPTSDPSESWFGRVNLALPSESWPLTNGKPLDALCQINLVNLPFRPPHLEDIDFIAVFIDSVDLPYDMPNGEHWCLRAYKNLDKLVQLPQHTTDSNIKPLPMSPRVEYNDYPSWEDIPFEIQSKIDLIKYCDTYTPSFGFKLGGWPMLVQSQILWNSSNNHPAKPEYVFQIDSTGDANWDWGDVGLGYLGRGTIPGKEDEWYLSWQCY